MSGSEFVETRKVSRLKHKFKAAMGPAGLFFRGFCENPRMVGSIVPSSRATINRMLAPVDWDNCKLFVEYGPGVGTFCGPVLDRLSRDGQMLVIDTNPLFIDYLRKTITDSRFHAVLGSAEDVEEIVRSIGHEKADYVLSGMPFSTLPEGVGPAIAAATQRVIRKGGAFMTYQFSTVARTLTGGHFARLETDLVWANVPPCFLGWAWND